MTCETCGVEMRVGDWPYCPHGAAQPSIVSDEVPGGFWAENGLPEPQFFTSKRAHVEALKANGKVIAAKWAGEQDKHLKRWDIPDAKTLENAAVLLTRGAR